MNKNTNVSKLRIFYFFVLCATIGLYIVLTGYFILTTLPQFGSLYYPKNYISYKLYYFGPLFSENKIKANNRFLLRYKTNHGKWSQWKNIEKENFIKYSQGFFNYASLKRSRFERKLANIFYYKVKGLNDTNYKEVPIFKSFNSYLHDYYLQSTNADSLQIIYLNVWERSKKDTSNKIDTLLNVRYKYLPS